MVSDFFFLAGGRLAADKADDNGVATLWWPTTACLACPRDDGRTKAVAAVTAKRNNSTRNLILCYKARKMSGD